MSVREGQQVKQFDRGGSILSKVWLKNRLKEERKKGSDRRYRIALYVCTRGQRCTHNFKQQYNGQRN